MFEYERPRNAYIGDSIPIDVFLYDENGENLIPSEDISAVTFTVVVPGDDPTSPTVDTDAGDVIGDGNGHYEVDAAVNTVDGNYLGKATFTYTVEVNSTPVTRTKNVPFEYNIIDPFERTGSNQPYDPAVAWAWGALNDCFDSTLGGPWLKDMSKNHFDYSTVVDMIPSVLLEINSVMPQTSFDAAGFPYDVNDGTAIMGQGLLVATIRHLMRSYTEQPDITNNQVGFFDRKRYQEAWSVIYQIELDDYRRKLELWKRRYLDISGARVSVYSKSGRLMWGLGRSRGYGYGGWG